MRRIGFVFLLSVGCASSGEKLDRSPQADHYLATSDANTEMQATSHDEENAIENAMLRQQLEFANQRIEHLESSLAGAEMRARRSSMRAQHRRRIEERRSKHRTMQQAGFGQVEEFIRDPKSAECKYRRPLFKPNESYFCKFCGRAYIDHRQGVDRNGNELPYDPVGDYERLTEGLTETPEERRCGFLRSGFAPNGVYNCKWCRYHYIKHKGD